MIYVWHKIIQGWSFLYDISLKCKYLVCTLISIGWLVKSFSMKINSIFIFHPCYTQLEVMLDVWKGVPYTKKFCWGSNLGKVKNEKHLFLVCPNTQKVRKHFCLALPFTHTSTLVELMETMNSITLAKFVACCQYKRTICLPWFAFRLMDSLVPNGRKIVNNNYQKALQKQIKKILIFLETGENWTSNLWKVDKLKLKALNHFLKK
jgi:hypothetical protein